ncbi:hypothetical protein HK105_202556 [Polyrhizophydium stewartii]|uniref:U6 snRNA-associated Sm-like protein LSm1 n=1 Tax=Polyrhizophydium stewartii TaxID=2732419 RepID=A0ABR4NDT0_9FUNG|nr:SM-like, degradation of cytoplasmic mRNAs and positively regulates transcription initiation [Polyrhizophydium stewartii]
MDNFLPGSASLVDCVDKKLLVTLRDGRHLYGWLRSYDQFANLVLQDTVERTFVSGRRFSDAYRGVFAIRGENVVLLGEIDPQKEALAMEGFTEIPAADAIKEFKLDQDNKKKRRDRRNRVLASHGFSVDVVEHDNY